MEDLKAIVARVFNIDINQVNDALSQDSIVEWDSFQHILLITEIENSRGIRFTVSDVEQARTFKDLREIVSRKEQNEDNN